MTPDTRPLPAPPATIPMRLPADLRDVDKLTLDGGDAVILRLNATDATSRQAAIAELQATARAALPGIPLLVVDGALVGVHVVRAATHRRSHP